MVFIKQLSIFICFSWMDPFVSWNR